MSFVLALFGLTLGFGLNRDNSGGGTDSGFGGLGSTGSPIGLLLSLTYA